MGAKFRRETAASALGEDEEEIDSTLYSEIDVLGPPGVNRNKTMHAFLGLAGSLGPSWGHLGPSWVPLGPSWG